MNKAKNIFGSVFLAVLVVSALSISVSASHVTQYNINTDTPKQYTCFNSTTLELRATIEAGAVPFDEDTYIQKIECSFGCTEKVHKYGADCNPAPTTRTIYIIGLILGMFIVAGVLFKLK